MSINVKRSLLIYDGECDFCIFWINRWSHFTQDRIDYVPYQEIYRQLSEIPISEFQNSVVYIIDDGCTYSGAEAIFRALDNRVLIWFYEKIPGLAPVTEFLYNFVAKRRIFFSKLTRLFFRSYGN